MLEKNPTVIEMKNAFDGLNSTLDTAEERIAELEDIWYNPQQSKKGIKTRRKQDIWEPWENYKIRNMCNENTRRRRKNGYFKQMTENSLS